ncbi:MAG: hypothetical protein A2511_04310 [Deltaproteobacteria bacterium RIFOXYD12_FULL_50_9]|nr:MAG: hypothetical protein A2511_04310 [Deltaproteobacteria bacterium RIFOXYD12_FULL_50_9]
MSFLSNFFGKKNLSSSKTNAVKPKPRTCMVCGKTVLKYPNEVTDGNFDGVARECPRCESQICIVCLRKLPTHEDGSANLCPACNKYSIFELTGHSPASRQSCKRNAEEEYGK